MITTITHEFRIDNVLTDPDSVVLADYTGTFGVKRMDTDAVVVAVNTAMVKSSTGVYAYSFDDPAYNLTYEYWIKFVISGTTLYAGAELNGSSTLNGYTLVEMINKLGLRLNELNQAGDEPFEFKPYALVTLLNQAQDKVLTKLPLSYFTDFHEPKKGNVLDVNGSFDLTTLTYSIFHKTVGLMGVRLNGDKFCRKVSYSEYLELEQVETKYNKNDPIYYIRGNNIYIEPHTTGDTVDITYMREADTMALDGSNNHDNDVNCELPKEAQEALLEFAASEGYIIGKDKIRADDAYDRGILIIQDIKTRHDSSDSVNYGLTRNLSFPPFQTANPFSDIYTLGH